MKKELEQIKNELNEYLVKTFTHSEDPKDQYATWDWITNCLDNSDDIIFERIYLTTKEEYVDWFIYLSTNKKIIYYCNFSELDSNTDYYIGTFTIKNQDQETKIFIFADGPHF